LFSLGATNVASRAPPEPFATRDDASKRHSLFEAVIMSVTKRIFTRRLAAMAVAAFSFFCIFPVAAAGAAPAALERVEIVTATGSHLLQVEVARTAKEREKGLMFRTSLPENGGMLFDFHREQTIYMWMKNTPLPLDMIFVSRAGRVVSLALGTEPFSERVISSGVPAAAVIEVNAGTVRRLSIATGDIVKHASFKN
jgi:uncharacterized membrane protein (UPF0127 family)